MKGIYTNINDTIYKIDQVVNTTNLDVVKLSKSNVSNLTIDRNNSTATFMLLFNTLDTQSVKTNKELFDTMSNFITDNKVTQIDKIQNKYNLYVDYSLYNNLGEEVEHAVSIKPIEPTDVIVPLGINTDNEFVYRICKLFKNKLDFSFKIDVPFGIMRNKPTRYTLKLNNVVIFQDFNYYDEQHKSIYETPFIYGSKTVESTLKDMAPIYSTQTEGIEIQEINLDFMPRKITVDFTNLLSNYIIAYDTTDVDKLIIKNITDKDDVTTGLPSSYPPADGSIEPDENGSYDYYEKCESDTVNCLQVVEDLYPDDSFKQSSMIRKKDVVLDLPDINIGDYVHYVLITK